ncbi:MAG: amino acid adenylation domain-containing protein [Halanaerobiales bacterium]|nr:amino acid adenylation domain-containing protein [Halanaerobiales bacterium]
MGRINKKDIEMLYALTPIQEGILFHYLENPDGDIYFEQLCLHISGEVDINIFKAAWNFVAETNELLRTVFRWNQIEKPIQIILKDTKLDVRSYDFANTSNEKYDQWITEILRKDREEKFDLEQVPFRVTLCQFGEEKFALIISHHHILYDGWSTGIILKEFFDTYNKLAKNEEFVKLKKNKYSSFIKWLKNQDYKQNETYWKEYLDNITVQPFLPVKCSRKKEERATEITQYKFSFTEDLTNEIENFVKEQSTTLATLLYSGWGILLQRYNNMKDVMFGTTVSGRNADINNIEDIVGLFINTLPLRINTNANNTVLDLLDDVNQSLKERKKFESTSLVDIKRYCEINTRENLFDSIVVLENYPIDKIIKDENNIVSFLSYSIFEATNFDLTVSITTHDKIEVTFIYNNSLFTDETITRIAKHYEIIINKMISDYNSKIDDIDILTNQEREQFLFEFNNTRSDYPKDKTIHELFEEQVEKNTNNVAVIYDGMSITYKELNEKANQLARVLRESGVKPDTFVGIMVERSIEMMLGILAILKSGGAYVPIDPHYPAPRIKYMLDDSKAKILLTQERFLTKIKEEYNVLNLEDRSLYTGDTTNLDRVNTSKDLAYLIYTSGSTGRPKGVMIEHHSVLNRLKWQEKRYPLNKNDVILQKTPYTFDVSVWELFLWAIAGVKVCFLITEGEKDPVVIVDTIEREQITRIHFVPSMLNVFLEYVESEGVFEKIKSLEHVFASGEELKVQHVEKFNQLLYKKNGIKLTDLYGPTEATVEVSYFDCYLEESYEVIPIGKPINNTNLLILDNKQRLVPIGVAGELCISGVGLARGYLHRPELTEEKFIAHPFNEGERLYRTGDLARWLADGNIEFLGRLDYQVKIRGYRIELGEIQSRLMELAQIKDAVVIDRTDKNGVKYLCAYVVASDNIDDSEMRTQLSHNLPEYMVPSYFVQLEKMPLNPNGKIDRKALPDIEVNVEEKYAGPRNEVEEKLVEIWAKILDFDKDKIGIDASFLELGGHSLKAIRLVSKMHKVFDVKIPMADIFKLSTIRGLRDYIDKAKEDKYFSIEVAEKKDNYQLSSAQKRIYVLQQMEVDNTSYNMPSMVELEGEIDIEKFKQAFNSLIQRQENLRLSFELIDGEPVQKVHANVEFEIEYYESGEDVEVIIEKFIRSFDLAYPPLFRVGLIKKDDTHHLLMIDMHHIISDGVSMGILQKEFMATYEGKDLPDLRVQYKDFSEWQIKKRESEEIKNQEEFWVNEFADDIPILNLPSDYLRPTHQSFAGNSIHFELTKEETGLLKEIALKEETTLFMVLLASFNLFLAKISGQEDIVIGTPVAGRRHTDLDNIIGMFVNTLAIRNYPVGNKSFREFLKEVTKRTFEILENQDYQFEDLVDKVVKDRDVSRNPLFDVMFVLQNMDIPELEITGLKLKPYEYDNKISKFDLGLYGIEVEDQILFTLEYCTKLFKGETIERFKGYFRKVIIDIIKNTDIKLSDLELITEEEKRKILFEFNDTRASYPNQCVFHQLFEEQVNQTPNKLAVVYKDQQITYQELDQKANRLARKLRANGVKNNSIVGIIIDPSIEMILGILGIIKAGGAYLSIAPENPDERIKYLLDDSNLHIVLTQTDLKMRLENVKFSAEVFDLFDDDIFDEESERLENINQPNDLAYVIYTSGSTGKPKGVMIEHKSLINLCYWHNTYHGVTESDRVAKYAGFGFDASIMETFPYLIKGACIYVLEKDIKLDINKLNQYYEENQITIGFLPTKICEQFMHLENHSLRIMITGGEKLTDFSQNDYRVVDYYGPTENTVVTTAFTVDKKYKNIPIGKPVFNNQIYIVDKHGHLQPIGIPGELCVSGDGLARGYLNRSELTAEKFVCNVILDDPIGSLVSDESAERMYLTGDLARWLPDGNIEFLGRKDRQVKIRGCRIELGEIENQLKEIDSIKEAIVIDQNSSNNEKYLAAYIVTDEEIDESHIRQTLLKELPDYMIPACFVRLDAIPFTPNGKVDRKALPIPEFSSKEEFVAPRGELEERIARIWADVLGLDRVGVNDNFFNLGGHSLKAVSLLAQIKKEVEVEIPLKELFSSPTIEGIVNYISEASRTKHISIEPIEKQDYYSLSPAQRRLYIINELEGPNTVYNLPGTMLIEGKLDLNRFEDIFNALIKRHESLRTSFTTKNGEPVQIINETVQLKVKYFKEKESDVTRLVEEFIQPFDITKVPLLRVGLIEIEKEKYVMMFDMHHMVSDGVSMQIIVREFIQLYQGNKLSELRIQYKDFSDWQNDEFESDELKKQEEYWLSQFKGKKIPILNMPTDYPRPFRQNFAGESIELILDEDLSNELFLLTTNTETTLFMVLLAAYNIFLAKYANQEDIIVGTPIAGRQHADLENIIGMFVNTLALRNKPTGDKSFIEFLQEVKENALNAYQSQDYQFDQLVWKLGIERDPGRNPLFDAMIVSRDKDIQQEFADLKISSYEFDYKIAHFDLLLEVSEIGKRVGLILEYATALFKRSTAEKMLERFVKILKQIVEEPEKKIRDITVYHELLEAKSGLVEDDEGDFGF